MVGRIFPNRGFIPNRALRSAVPPASHFASREVWMTGYRRVIGTASQSPRLLRRKWDDLRRQLDHMEGDAGRLAWLRIRAIERILAACTDQKPVRTRLNFQWLKSIAQGSRIGIPSPLASWRGRTSPSFSSRASERSLSATGNPFSSSGVTSVRMARRTEQTISHMGMASTMIPSPAPIGLSPT
jgi:hypothetical protein